MAPTAMTEIRFYHLQRQDLEKVLPQLLSKTLERGWRAIVQTASVERRDALNAWLWTYSDESFLPHGTDADGFPADQPIWLTAETESPNGATVLFLADNADRRDLTGFDLVCYLFDGRDPDSVSTHRERWKTRKAEGHSLTYWQQGERGGWQKKAETKADNSDE